MTSEPCNRFEPVCARDLRGRSRSLAGGMQEMNATYEKEFQRET